MTLSQPGGCQQPTAVAQHTRGGAQAHESCFILLKDAILYRQIVGPVRRRVVEDGATPNRSFIALEDARAYRHCAPEIADGAAILCTVWAHGAQTQPLATLSWQGVGAHGSANAHEGQHTTHIGRPIAQHKVFS